MLSLGLGRATCPWATASRHPAARPRDSSCLLVQLRSTHLGARCPLGSVPPTSEDVFFPAWMQISVASVPASVGSLLVKRVPRTESVFTAVAECCSPVACRCSNVQPPGTESACKPEAHIVFLSSCIHSTLPACTWTAPLLEDELKTKQCP